VRSFRQELTLEDVIEFHAFASLGANRCVTNAVPLGCSLLLPVVTVNLAQTLNDFSRVLPSLLIMNYVATLMTSHTTKGLQ
jgi:hypothetical protein